MQDRLIKTIDIVRYKNSEKFIVKDRIIDEDILKIFINEKEYFNMVFSMTKTCELAAGFLFTQGIIQKRDDLTSIEFSKEKKECHLTLNKDSIDRLEDFKKGRQIKGSSGGTLLNNPDKKRKDIKDKDFTIKPAQVLSLIESHFNSSKIFHLTGAVHSAGICDADQLLSYYEDIGRHNALDKMAGDIFLNQIDTSRKIATVSCRMSLEIIGKIMISGLPIVISNAAPTLSALELAKNAGITIIGFARENRFNIYTHDWRINL